MSAIRAAARRERVVGPGTRCRRVRFVDAGYPEAMELIAILILIGVVVFVIAKKSGPRQQG
jgi:hypothetical protein